MIKLFYAAYTFFALAASAVCAYIMFLLLMRRRIKTLFLSIDRIRDKQIHYPPFVNYSSLAGTVMSGKLEGKKCSFVFKKEKKSIYLIYIFEVNGDHGFLLYNKNMVESSFSSSGQPTQFMGKSRKLGESSIILESKSVVNFSKEDIDLLVRVMSIFPSILYSKKHILFSKRLLARKDLQIGGLEKYLTIIEPAIKVLEKKI